MANDGGSVDIRITGSVDPSVAAAANQAKASMGGLGDATAGFTAKANVSNAAMKELVAVSGSWDKALKALSAANGNVAVALAASTAAEEANTAAIAANTGATINSRAAYEATVLVHEALQGRFSRMIGSSMILSQQLAGQGATTRLVTFATSGLGLAVIGTTVAIGSVIVATLQYEAAQRKLLDVSVGLAAQSGLTAEQLNQAAHAAANWAEQSIAQSTRAAEAFASAGIKSQDTITKLAGAVGVYARLTGVDFADAQKTLAQAMQDPIKGAQDLNQQLGILDSTQLAEIQRLVDLGQKEQATAILTDALKQRTDEASAAGLGAASTWGQMSNALSNLWGWLGKTSDRLIEQTTLLGAYREQMRGVAAEQAQAIQNQSQLNQVSARGAAVFATTPEGQAIQERNRLRGSLSQARDALAVDIAVHGEHSEAVKRDRQSIEDYTHAVNTYLTPVEKKVKIDELDAKISQARHGHNRQLVTDLAEQKALLQESGRIESDADAKALARGAGDKAGGRTFAPKGGRGPSIVSEWTEQLHNAEILSNNFFADQTDAELKFWQGKLASTKTGSKEWLEVQAKIYEASKTIAHREYDEHIADLNDRLEADRSDFKKVQADWAEKLEYIRSKFGEESVEYKNAHRQMLSEERRHQEDMLQAELTGNNKAIQALKAHLASEEQTRRTYASAAESIIQQKASGQILGEVNAATQIAQLHRQIAEQEIQDARTAFFEEEKLRQKGLIDAKKFYGEDSAAYKKALADDVNSQRAFQDQIRSLEAKGYAQQIQDLNRLKQAYHSYIDGTVNAAVSGLANMLDGTGTWRDAVIGIYNSLKSAIEQVISQIITNWIVNLLVGKAAQQTANEATALSYVGLAGAAGVASWAGAPWPIDAGAPAFGSAMASAAAGYASLAALDQGTNYLPRDQVVQAHEGERIIPKADNRKLMEMMSLAVSGAGGGGGRGGDIHLHSSPTFNGNQASLWEQMVSKHEREMMRWFGRKFKNSSFDRAAA